jgi:hypothetical protein
LRKPGGQRQEARLNSPLAVDMNKRPKLGLLRRNEEELINAGLLAQPRASIPSSHRNRRHALQLGSTRAIARKDRHTGLNRLHEPGERMSVGSFWDFAAPRSLL